MIVPSYYPRQLKGKLMNQSLENSKKPNIGPDFGPFGGNLGPQFFFVSFTSTSSKTLFQGIILCNLKENE